MMNFNDYLKQYIIKVDNKDDNLSDLNEKENCKIISFYAEKGGVGKTTICFTLAYTFAQQGKRVLIYDCDVQRSLTAWAFGVNIEQIKNVERIDKFIKDLPRSGKFQKTLYEQVMDESTNAPHAAYAVKLAENLYVVPGDKYTSELDAKINYAESMTNGNPNGNFANNMSALPYYSIKKTADFYKVDYVFLDLNPYPGALNRCLIMSSHYLVIPACLSYFCVEMMHKMKWNIDNWNSRTKDIKDSTRRRGSIFPWPNHSPRFLGVIINMFMVNNFSEMKLRNNEQLVKEKILEEACKITTFFGDNERKKTKLAVSSYLYEQCGLNQELGVITEYYGLKDLSEIFHIPVPFLTEKEFIKYDSTHGEYKSMTTNEKFEKTNQVERFQQMFKNIAHNIFILAQNDAEEQKIERLKKFASTK